MSIRFFAGFVAVSLVVLTGSSNSFGGLIMHFNPSDLSRMFENGNTTGGTDALDTPFIGETVRWIESQVNGFDIQQATAGPLLGAGPGGSKPYVLEFNGGSQNLLALSVNAGNILSPVTELNTDTLTIVLAGRANADDAGLSTFINFNYAAGMGGADLVSLEYDHDAKQLIGRASGGSVSAAVVEGEWFVAELVWDGGNGVSLSIDGALAGTDTSSAVAGADFDRFRIGLLASNSGTLNASIGDVYIFDTASEDNDALVASLVATYAVPEPGSLLLVGSVLLAMAMKSRSRFNHL